MQRNDFFGGTPGPLPQHQLRDRFIHKAFGQTGDTNSQELPPMYIGFSCPLYLSMALTCNVPVPAGYTSS